jgi:hypothetical protein
MHLSLTKKEIDFCFDFFLNSKFLDEKLYIVT